MKNVITVLACIISFSLFGQDLIVQKNGEIIEAKVSEILPDLVKYKKFASLDGPFYSISKNDVVVIKYESGNTDVFADQKTADQKTSNGRFKKGTLVASSKSFIGGLSFNPVPWHNSSAKQNQIDINLGIGYFVLDNLLLQPEISYYFLDADLYPYTRTSLFSTSLSASYFIDNLALSSYLQSNIIRDDDYPDNITTRYWGIAVGYSFFLNESISIEPRLGKVLRIKNESNIYTENMPRVMKIWSEEHDSRDFPLHFDVNLAIYFNRK